MATYHHLKYLFTWVFNIPAIRINIPRAGKAVHPRQVALNKLRSRKRLHELTVINAVDQLGFDYRIRLSDRRTASIEIKEGVVTVAAPFHTPIQELHVWVEQKAAWIRKKLDQHQQRLAQIPQRDYCHGEHIPYLGKPICLDVLGVGRSYTHKVGDSLKLVLSQRSRKIESEQIRTQVEAWYKSEGLKLLTTKSRSLAKQLALPLRQVELRKTRSKWGHCTREGNIQYNWLIMQAPESVVDYLVTHEVCHLKHLNHSGRYWQLVHQVYPNYQQAQQWLKDFGHTLVL